jgi:hypothetical protein
VRDVARLRGREKLEEFRVQIEDGSVTVLEIYQYYRIIADGNGDERRVNTRQQARSIDGRSVRRVSYREFVVIDPIAGDLKATRLP